MKTSASTFWDFGSIPMIEPEFLGNILATSSDIAVMIDLQGSIKSVLVNQSEQYYGDLSKQDNGCQAFAIGPAFPP